MMNMQRHLKEKKECLEKPFGFTSVQGNTHTTVFNYAENNIREAQRAAGFVLYLPEKFRNVSNSSQVKKNHQNQSLFPGKL